MTIAELQTDAAPETLIAALEISDARVTAVLVELRPSSTALLEDRFAAMDVLSGVHTNINPAGNPEAARKAVSRTLRSVGKIAERQVTHMVVASALEHSFLETILDPNDQQCLAQVPSSFAAAFAVCTQQQLDEGVMVLHVGDSHTSLVHLQDGKILQSSSSPMGANHILDVLAGNLGAKATSAKILFSKFAALSATAQKSDDVVSVDQFSETSIETTTWAEVDLFVRQACGNVLDNVALSSAEMLSIPEDIPFLITGGLSSFAGFQEITKASLSRKVRTGQLHWNETLPALLRTSAFVAPLGMACMVCAPRVKGTEVT